MAVVTVNPYRSLTSGNPATSGLLLVASEYCCRRLIIYLRCARGQFADKNSATELNDKRVVLLAFRRAARVACLLNPTLLRQCKRCTNFRPVGVITSLL